MSDNLSNVSCDLLIENRHRQRHRRRRHRRRRRRHQRQRRQSVATKKEFQKTKKYLIGVGLQKWSSTEHNIFGP